MCQIPFNRRTDGRTDCPSVRPSLRWSLKRTDGLTDKHARQRPPRLPPSRRVDVAATRDKPTDGQTRRTDEETRLFVRPSARLLDGVWHYRHSWFYKWQ